LGLSFLVLGFVTSRSAAEVTFQPAAVPLADIVTPAAAEERIVMLVVTQPDWCPPCIHLDRTFLRNPDAADIRALTKNWVVVEVHGYEPAGKAALEQQQIEFVGTPTTFVIKLRAGDKILRDGELLGSVVGAPDDYVLRLRQAADHNDDTETLEAAAKRSGRPEDWMTLGARYVERGQAARATMAYQRVIGMSDASTFGLSADSLAALQKTARWKLATEVTQSVEKDHGRAIALLARYAELYPEESNDPDVLYATFFSELKAGHAAEILPLIEETYLKSGELDDLKTFLYLAFRTEQPDVLELGVKKAREGIARFPEAEASLSAGLGRVLRALGQNKRAAEAFKRAVELTDPADDVYPVYRAQYDHAAAAS
jgi:tetratricopeptide (TPR) repeat protein